MVLAFYGMAVLPCYGVSRIERGCSTTSELYEPALKCAVLSQVTALLPCYGMCGTEFGYCLATDCAVLTRVWWYQGHLRLLRPNRQPQPAQRAQATA
eukprot:1436120-Rhodomonas_salina.1